MPPLFRPNSPYILSLTHHPERKRIRPVSPAPYDLIIFDCDGTLVNSEALNNSVTAEMIADMGLPQYDLQYCLDNFAGITLTNIIQILEERHPDVKFPDDAIELCREKVALRMPTELAGVPHAVETVAALMQGYKICVASNGERGSVLQSLDLTDLKPFFADEIVFTANMVAHPKPAPDLFLYAAQKMGVAPERCLVIEDSIFGVRAARAAGMDVLGITGVHHDPGHQAVTLRENGATGIIITLPGILEYLTLKEKAA